MTVEPEDWRQECQAVQAELDALLEDAPVSVDHHVEAAAEELQTAMDTVQEVHLDAQ